MNLFLLFLISLTVSAQNKKIDSLKLVLSNQLSDSVRIDAICEIAWEYKSVSNFSEGNRYAELAIDYCDSLLILKESFRRNNVLNFKAKGLNTIGMINYQKGEYPLALKYLGEAKLILDTTQNEKQIAIIYNNLGLVYARQGFYPMALTSYYASLKLKEKLADQKGIAATHNNIALIYHKQKEYESALEHFFISINIKKEMKDTLNSHYANTLNNIALVLTKQNKLSEALSYLFRTLELMEKLKDTNGIINAYINIGIIEKGNEMVPQALVHLTLAYNLAEKIENSQSMLLAHISLADVKMKQNNFIIAKQHLNEALIIARRIRNKENFRDIYEGYAKLFEMTGSYKDAYSSYKLYVLYRDSLVNEENIKRTVETQMQYNYDKKSAADSIQNAEIRKQVDLKNLQEIQKQKLYTYGGICGFALMLVVAAVSIRAFRNKQKANAIIMNQKLLVEEKQKEILDSIHYAKRIQQSLMPPEKYIQKNINRLKGK